MLSLKVIHFSRKVSVSWGAYLFTRIYLLDASRESFLKRFNSGSISSEVMEAYETWHQNRGNAPMYPDGI